MHNYSSEIGDRFKNVSYNLILSVLMYIAIDLNHDAECTVRVTTDRIPLYRFYIRPASYKSITKTRHPAKLTILLVVMSAAGPAVYGAGSCR